MFFFFVGGVEQQVSQVLKKEAGRCIRCGSLADLVEYEKVLKLFFVPAWRWPGKGPLMHCDNCSLFFPQSFSLPPNSEPTSASLDHLRCRYCDRAVDSEFKFCPFCGSAL
ncbi:Zinc-ribbon 15 [Dillenia turbinata]|uniref:Zinc-ribbon 15 n=1 Tax=Dillenia turbinata TaxID=194707 RepID=A0AAN8ZMY8_9MAGN